ncbi:MAG: hypothetical protein ACOCWG_04820 [bacterium]
MNKKEQKVIEGRINNFETIRKLLDFERSKDDFYFLQILQRKKDHGQSKVNGANNNSRLIKAYYIHSLDYFDFIKPEVIEICNIFNARAGINLNRRSYEQMAFHLLRKIADQIMNKSFDKAYAAYNHVVGAYSQETDKKWIIDLDGDQDNFDMIFAIEEFISEIQPNPGVSKTIARIPSKNGCHIIPSPFNLLDFKKRFPDIEVHKNNPTNLYIP